MYQFKLVSWIVLILCFSNSCKGFRISQLYSMVEALGNSCPASESCEHRWLADSDPEATPNEYTCACDDQCSEYGDCCIDAPRRPLEKNQMTCVEVDDQEGVYMIDSCPRDYNGSEIIRQLCDLIYINYQPDPLFAKPITDFTKGITYKNGYCWHCNHNMEKLPMWNETFADWPQKLDCSHQPDESSRNNAKRIESGWGGLIYILHLIHSAWPKFEDSDIDVWFKGCDVVSTFPLHLQDKVRRCRPNLVSDCPSSWKDEYVRSMCESYTGARFDHRAEGRGYRNVHCAICNGVDVTRLSCLPLKRNDTYVHSRNDTHAQIEVVKEKMKQCMKIDRENKYCVFGVRSQRQRFIEQ